MATTQKAAENFTTEHMDNLWGSLDKALTLPIDNMTESEILRSRINEQSSLICILKQRVDELLLQCQALEKISTEQEGRMTDCQRELDSKRKRAELLEKRFLDLAANTQAITTLMTEYKSQNAQLKMENQQLQSEHDRLFLPKLHDKEALVQKLTQEIELLSENYSKKEKEYQEKLAECQSKLLEEATQHRAKETSLRHQLHDTQQQQKEAAEMCRALKLKLKMNEDKNALKEIEMRKSITNLSKEKDKLLAESVERGRAIQEKQEEIQQLEKKLKEAEKSRADAEDRFKQDAEAVIADVRVKSLQCALEESATQYEKLKKDLEAVKEHCASLLKQERELNKKLCYMMG